VPGRETGFAVLALPGFVQDVRHRLPCPCGLRPERGICVRPTRRKEPQCPHGSSSTIPRSYAAIRRRYQRQNGRPRAHRVRELRERGLCSRRWGAR
jgi:hypothetical protein